MLGNFGLYVLQSNSGACRAKFVMAAMMVYFYTKRKKILLPGSDPLSIASQAENIPDYVDVFAFFNISVLMLF